MSMIIQKRLQSALSIRSEDGKAEHSMYQHSILCQTFFPYKNPGSIDFWKRRQGKALLSVQALRQLDPLTGEDLCLGIPYGAKARLVMAFLSTEIVRRQSPIIEVSSSISAFIKADLGLDANGRTIKEVKNQLARLAGSVLSVSFQDQETGLYRRIDSKIVRGYTCSLINHQSQPNAWSGQIHISPDFANHLLQHAVPLDMRAIAALANSPMALDIYTWLAYRLHRIPPNLPVFVPWKALYEQFGFGYTRIRDFRKKFLLTLKEVKLVYPDARIDWVEHKKSQQPAGIMLYHSPPAIRRKLILPVSFPNP